MSQYKEIRTRSWFTDLYISKYENKPYDFENEQLNEEHLNTIALE